MRRWRPVASGGLSLFQCSDHRTGDGREPISHKCVWPVPYTGTVGFVCFWPNAQNNDNTSEKWSWTLLASSHTSKDTMKSSQRISLLTCRDGPGVYWRHGGTGPGSEEVVAGAAVSSAIKGRLALDTVEVQQLITHPLSDLYGSFFSGCNSSIKAATASSSFSDGSCCSFVNDGNVRWD